MTEHQTEDLRGHYVEPLAFSRKTPRAGYAIVVGSLLAIASAVTLALSDDRPVVLIILASLALLPILFGFGFIGMGFSSDARNIAVVGTSSKSPSGLRAVGSLMASAAAAAIGGASLGPLGAVGGGLVGVVVWLTTGEPKPKCRVCSKRHADHWDHAYCGDGFRWTQQDLNRDENLWLTREHVAIIVGVTHDQRAEEAHRVAAVVFSLASAKQVVTTVGNTDRIQQRELHALLPQAMGRLLPPASTTR